MCGAGLREIRAMPKYYTQDLFYVLANPFNRDIVCMQTRKGETIRFEQVFFTHLRNKKGRFLFYCILKPLDNIPGVADDEAIIFRVISGSGRATRLKPEFKRKICTEVDKLYREALDQAHAEEKNATPLLQSEQPQQSEQTERSETLKP